MPANLRGLARKDFLSLRLLGVFLFVFFGLFARNGAGFFVGERGWYPEWSAWNILTYPIGYAGVRAFFLFMAIAALGLAARRFSVLSALLLFYGLAAAASVDIYMHEFYWSYMGWMLLASVVYRDDPRAFRILRFGAWLVFGFSFSASGIGKIMGGDLWLNGQAISVFFSIAKPNPAVHFIQQNPLFARDLTWLTLVFEVAALPLSFFRYTRPVLLLFGFGMHSFIIFLSGKSHLLMLSFGALIFYFFLLEITYRKAP